MTVGSKHCGFFLRYIGFKFCYSFQVITIADLRESLDKNPNTLKGYIVCCSPSGWKTYQTAGGVQMSKLNFMFADQGGFVKGVVFGEKFASSVAEGRSVALQEFIYKDKTLGIVSGTKVYR